MARRSDHSKEELETLILETSWKIIGEEGFEGLSARRIAKEIGYAPGTIYNLFESMDHLYLFISGRVLDKLYEELSRPDCNDDEKAPIENMKKMASIYMDFAKEYRPYWLMLFRVQMPEFRKTEAWYQVKVERLFTPLENLLKPYFEDKSEEEQKTAARVLWSSIHGLCFLQETGKITVLEENLRAEPMSDYLIETFLRGVKNS